jgi:hypothetical protein
MANFHSAPDFVVSVFLQDRVSRVRLQLVPTKQECLLRVYSKWPEATIQRRPHGCAATEARSLRHL